MNSKSLKEYIEHDPTTDKLPFISTITLINGTVLKGMVINDDKTMISFYDILQIKDEEELYSFIETCLDWWWYSNKRIPINIFYPEAMSHYYDILRHHSKKGIADVKGHTVSLETILEQSKPYRKTVIVGKW